MTVNQRGGSTNSANWRTRTFAYDSLSRLTSATNPESGTITYTYDADGNLATKTSPAPNQTGTATVVATFSYDALNRLTQKSFNDGTTPTVKYVYDGAAAPSGCTLPVLTYTNPIGRRTGMCDAAGSEAWSFDPIGRIAADARITNGLTKKYTYTYNLDGSLSTVTHPDTLVVTFTQGGAGLPLSESSADATYAYNVHYTPGGTLCYWKQNWGSLTTANRNFNNRLQPVRIYESDDSGITPPTPCTAPTQNSNLPVDFTYTYADASGHNNGNVQTIVNNHDWHRTQSFSYDSLNRISAAWTRATNQPGFNGDTQSIVQCWAENYSYDPWGNLVSLLPSSSSSYTGCTQESGFNFTGSIGANNRIIASGYGYDAAGNLTTNPGVGTQTFDAENHLVSVGGQTYLYDGDGKRVEKASGSPLTANKLYWYGADSSPVLETDASGNGLFRYFRFQGLLVTREEANDWVDHYGLDALGNVRWLLATNSQTPYTVGWDESDYYPFGGERVIRSNSTNRYKFTSKERDSESGLDNFGARFDSSTLGRFMSPDWSQSPTPVPYASLPYPQSLNLYSYVQNNPLNFADPSGHKECTVDGEKHGSFWCWRHKHGWAETQKERETREKNEAEAAAAWSAFVRQHPEYSMQNMFLNMVVPVGTVGALTLPEVGGIEESAAPEIGVEETGAAATGAGVPRTMVNGVPQPNPNGEIIVGPNGTAVKIPAGYVAAAAESGSGIVYRPAGSTGNANSIRIMGPNATQPARVIIYNSNGQPIVPSTGKPGPPAQTHTPLQ